jgi:hypothetical protein
MTDEIETVNTAAADGLPATGTAAEKLGNTLRELSQPDEDAGAMELTLASVAMGLEQGLGDVLERTQASGELDEFVLALTRFLAIHRSDSAKLLVVVEIPRRRDLPAGTLLHLLDEAIAATAAATSPL